MQVTTSTRRTLVIVVFAAAAALGLGLRRSDRGAAAHSAAPTASATAKSRVLALVGTREITEADLARYQAIHRLAVGATIERQALLDLCDRVLLERFAAESGLTVSPPELEQQVVRWKHAIAAGELATPRPATVPAVEPTANVPSLPGAPVVVAAVATSPMDRALARLAEAGLTESDLVAEVRGETLATKVRRPRSATEIAKLLAEQREKTNITLLQ